MKDLCSENYKSWRKKLKKILKGGKAFYIPGLEELILLKCPCYPLWYTHLMQSPSKQQWYSSD
jgi:hypothetical protein